MNITDYNKRLGDQRNMYQSKADELRENKEREIDSLEAVHKLKQKDQAKNFLNAKRDIEVNSERNIAENAAYTKETLSESKSRLNEQLAGEKERARENHMEVKDDFRKKITHLEDAFDKTNTERDKYTKHVAESLEKNYDNRKKLFRSEFDKDVKEVRKKADISISKTQSQQREERQNVEKRSILDKQEIVQNSNIMRDKANTKHQKEIEDLRNGQTGLLKQVNEHHQSQKKNILANKNNELVNLKENFGRIVDKVKDRNDSISKFEKRKNSKESATRAMQFKNDISDLRRVSNEKLKSGDQVIQKDRQVEQIVDSYEDRLDNFKKNVDDIRYKSQQDKERASASHTSSYKSQQGKTHKLLEQKEKDFRNFQEDTLGRYRDKNEQDVEQFRSELSKERQFNEETSLNTKQNNKSAMRNQKIIFGKTIETLNEKNGENIEKLNKDFSNEKSKIVYRFRNDIKNQRADMKDGFNKKITRTVEKYDNRIDNTEREKDRLVAGYEDKLEKIREKSSKEIVNISRLENEKRAELMRGAKRALWTQQQKNKLEMSKLRENFEKEISTTKHSSDLHLTKMVQRYEDLIDQERIEHDKEMRIKMSEANANYQRLYEQSRAEKEAQSHQYEMKLEKMRQSNALVLEEKSRELQKSVKESSNS